MSLFAGAVLTECAREDVVCGTERSDTARNNTARNNTARNDAARNDAARESTGFELDLLIRQARRRQRRRRLRVALSGALALGVAAAAGAAISGSFSVRPARRAASRGSTAMDSGRCPASPARLVSNATFAAEVIGKGRVRLGVGNPYQAASRRFFIYGHRADGWGGIEAIWWVPGAPAPGPISVRGRPLGKRGPISVRGRPLGKQGPISVRGRPLAKQSPLEFQPPLGRRATGSGTLTLSGPSAAYPAGPGAASAGAVYAGSLWVRAGGCYLIEISGRGLKERLVLDIVLRSGPYTPTPGLS